MSEQLLIEILGELKDVNQRLVNLDEGQNQTAVKVDSLGTSVHNLDTRMGSLETKFDNLDTRMETIETKVDGLDNRMGTLETKMDGLDNRMGTLETSVGDLKAGQTKLETRIENEVVDKIRILFDAHSLYMDYFASIKDSQARLENNLDSLTRRIIDFHIDLRDHEREIRLLRVERK
ncbi:MAG: coiled-coil domain-containing protein [Desulfocucumaceae bacterium]